VFLLQAWSTATSQTTKNTIATVARIFRSTIILRQANERIMVLPQVVECSDSNHAAGRFLEERLSGGFFRVALRWVIPGALQNGQAGIFWIAGVGGRELAHIEDGATVGFHLLHEAAICAEPDLEFGRIHSRLSEQKHLLQVLSIFNQASEINNPE
jgi:hypothetical protein